uniref:Uncharacterized protein n=1 Tax=Glossina pallidipes TaxID=7398 RepID=A0A1A9ZEG4_GLOPL
MDITKRLHCTALDMQQNRNDFEAKVFRDFCWFSATSGVNEHHNQRQASRKAGGQAGKQAGKQAGPQTGMALQLLGLLSFMHSLELTITLLGKISGGQEIRTKSTFRNSERNGIISKI